MKTAVSLIAALALAAGLTACGPSTGYNVPFCVDDAMTLPAGKAPNPSRPTYRPYKPKPYSKPSTTRTKTTRPYGYGGHHDDDCD